MEKKFIKKVYESVPAKIDKVENNLANYIMRAMLAGMFLTLIYTFVTQLNSDYLNSGADLGDPFGKTLMAYLFGIGLLFIVYMGAELFTSNTMYMSIGVMHRKIKAMQVVKLLTICWLANLAGAALCAFLLVQTGMFNAVDGHFSNTYLLELAAKKSTLGGSEVFFRAILANWVVNVVVFCAAVMKDDAAKVLLFPLGLMPFVYLGFEHSIANFGVFLMNILTPDAYMQAVYHGHHLSSLGIANNLFFATIGNIIGGAIFVGGYLALSHLKMADEQK
jgi:nitrite transporter